MMIIIVALVILLLFLLLLAQANSRLSQRLKAVENELEARFEINENEISELGGAVIVLQRLTGGPEKQGIREVGFDYDGRSLDNYKPIVPQPFADGEPYRDYSVEESFVSGAQGKDD